MTPFTIRKAIHQADIEFLKEMLYKAVFVPKGEAPPPKEIIQNPDLMKYIENWGRYGDYALIAVSDTGTRAGAIWVRLFDETNQTYGYINEETPVVSMAVLPEHRGQGIGTALLRQLFTQIKAHGYSALSLSVDPTNPALHLYQRHGFEKVGESGTSWDMKAHL